MGTGDERLYYQIPKHKKTLECVIPLFYHVDSG